MKFGCVKFSLFFSLQMFCRLPFGIFPKFCWNYVWNPVWSVYFWNMKEAMWFNVWLVVIFLIFLRKLNAFDTQLEITSIHGFFLGKSIACGSYGLCMHACITAIPRRMLLVFFVWLTVLLLFFPMSQFQSVPNKSQHDLSFQQQWITVDTKLFSLLSSK